MIKKAKITDEDKAICLQQGGVIFRIIAAFTTLIIIGALIYSLVQDYQQNGQEYHRKAIELSEYGMLLTLQKINEKPSWREGYKKTSYEDGFFSVELRPSLQEQTLFMTIVSRGYMNSVTEERQIVLMLQVEGNDSTWIPQQMR
ncbi:MAG: hypothetical protein GX267_07865 [Fibrobacter sp.]|jgi:uncharacterized membrane protein YraQ (UPF0718 family)|nr:hypothetical protein [Fibrobacter sp.]